MGEDICNTILKIHVLKRYRATNNIGTKAVALKASCQLLASFWQNGEQSILALKQTEKYLSFAICPKRNCDSFGDSYECHRYHSSSTSNMLQGHIS